MPTDDLMKVFMSTGSLAGGRHTENRQSFFPVTLVDLWSVKTGTGYYCSCLHNTKTCHCHLTASIQGVKQADNAAVDTADDGVGAVCQATGMLDCQRWHCSCSHQDRWKLKHKKTTGKSCHFLDLHFEPVITRSFIYRNFIWYYRESDLSAFMLIWD